MATTSEIDLRHLRIFTALYAAKNVTRTAEAVGLSQSSVSVVLAQLREHYGDPLFVRTSGGMQATPRAEALVPVIRQALQLLEQSLEPSAVFDPSSIARSYRICMTDVGQVTLLPRLLSRVQQIAPQVRIEVGNLTHNTPQQLESGEADLAMGFTFGIRAGFYQQKLFDEGFACIASRTHPRTGQRMTLSQLEKERHVKILLLATAHSIIDKFLERRGVHRTFALEVPTFLGLGQLVANSDLLAIVPLRLGNIFAAESGVQIVSLPVRFPSYAVNQYWHDRYHRDPGNLWLRSVVYETANALPLKTGQFNQAEMTRTGAE
ncbi:LysR family transcriptional regulator [Ottowia caeni]|uniref:LysR family transcriptional regulator n=1 Tax=Ottowia caeni TaxID=2870339 RepID=UPI001E4CF321|nr:LysR family transcriptional regulator [Ottowia caeni]